MKTQHILFFSLLLIAGIQSSLRAQQGIGTNSPNDSAILDLVSPNKGLLVPRISLTASTTFIDGSATNDDNGMLIYNTNTTTNTNGLDGPGFYHWSGGASGYWSRISSIRNGTTPNSTLSWNGNNWVENIVLLSNGSSQSSITTNLSVTGTLEVTENATLTADLYVGANTTANGTLTANSTTTLNATLIDALGTAGTDGQILSSTGTSTNWITLSSSSITDDDGDTQIQMEEGTDDDTIRFDTAGTERAVITNTGRLGVGISSPSGLLHLRENGTSQHVPIILQNNDITAGFELESQFATNSGQGILNIGINTGRGIPVFGTPNQYAAGWLRLDTRPAEQVFSFFYRQGGSTTESRLLTISGLDGSINVLGAIRQRNSNLHPDYVFEKYYEGTSKQNPSYHLPDLEELEVFLAKNLHLPGVQSRADIAEKGSWDISENVRTNLEKIEELFLYTIEQEKALLLLEKENHALKASLENILKRLEELEESNE